MRFSDIFDPNTRLGRVPPKVYGFLGSLAALLCAMAFIVWVG